MTLPSHALPISPKPALLAFLLVYICMWSASVHTHASPSFTDPDEPPASQIASTHAAPSMHHPDPAATGGAHPVVEDVHPSNTSTSPARSLGGAACDPCFGWPGVLPHRHTSPHHHTRLSASRANSSPIASSSEGLAAPAEATSASGGAGTHLSGLLRGAQSQQLPDIAAPGGSDSSGVQQSGQHHQLGGSAAS